MAAVCTDCARRLAYDALIDAIRALKAAAGSLKQAGEALLRAAEFNPFAYPDSGAFSAESARVYGLAEDLEGLAETCYQLCEALVDGSRW